MHLVYLDHFKLQKLIETNKDNSKDYILGFEPYFLVRADAVHPTDDEQIPNEWLSQWNSIYSNRITTGEAPGSVLAEAIKAFYFYLMQQMEDEG